MQTSVGDLVKVPGGVPGLVLSTGVCGEPHCDGDRQVGLLGPKGRHASLCYRKEDVELVAHAADLRV
jgi:hypothetical protein